jgi:hypothetical protein
MERNPTYILWHPVLIHNTDGFKIVTFNVTPMATNKMPKEPKKFFTQFLKEINISSKADTWEVLPYRSNYLGIKYKPGSWEDFWGKDWRITIKLAEPILKSPVWQDEFIASYAFSPAPEWHNTDEETTICCMIIADFQTKRARENTKRAISSSIQLQRLAMENLAPQPEFYDVNIGKKFFQLQISLGQFPQTFFENGAAYAVAVETLCRDRGGITDFYDRVNKWGDL